MKTFSKLKLIIGNYIFQKFGLPYKKGTTISKLYIKKFLPKNPIIIDCGANDGSDTLELFNVLKGEIHSFEPVESIFLKLKAKVKNNSKIHCYQIALSNFSGTQELYVSEGGSDGSSSLLEPKQHLIDHPDTIFNKKITVNTLTLKDWAEKYNKTKIDLLWLDMQGFEMEMLKASEEILKTVKIIHTEVSTKETYEGVPLYTNFRLYLESKGFEVILEAIPKGWDMGNVLFLKK